MRSDTLAHWCAALGAAHLKKTKVRWLDGSADLLDKSHPPFVWFPPHKSKRPLLVNRGRRDFFAGGRRALKWLQDMPAGERQSEWEWLLAGEQTAHQITGPMKGGRPDTYSIGTLYPSAGNGGYVPAWLAYLAAIGAYVLEGGLQRWPKRASMHPDVWNNFVAVCPSEWTSAEEIVAWYSMADAALFFELRPVLGELSSYCLCK